MAHTKNRTFIIILLGVMAAIGPFSIDMYLPAFTAIADSLNCSTAEVAYSLTSFSLGICVGQLIYGPVTDRFGRKPPLVIGLSLYLLTSLAIVFTTTVEQLIALRLVQALGGCAGIVISRAVIRDIFPPEEIASVFSTIMLVMGVAPVIAPTLGGLVVAHFSWEYIFLFLALMSLVMLLLIFFKLPESKGANKAMSLAPRSVLQNFKTVLFNRQFFVFTIAGSFSYAGLFAYLSGAPVVFMEILGFSDKQFGWIFGANAACYIIGAQVNRLALKRFSSRQIVLATGLSSFLMATALLSASALQWHLEATTIGCLMGFMFSLGFLNPNTIALALIPFTDNAGSASALQGSLQMGIGAVSSAAVAALANGTALPMAGAMTAGAAISAVILLINHQRYKKNLKPAVSLQS